MGYKLVRLTELMAYEFGQVEGDIEALNERDLGNVMPDGVSFSQFKEKLDSGEFALLTDIPVRPAMVHDNTNKVWTLSPDTETTLSPQIRSALMARANQSRSAVGGAGGSSHSAHVATNIEDTYVPEPVKPDRSNEPPPLKYEYCFEVASSDKVFSKTVGCKFQLATTQQEGVKDDWQTARTEHGTKYTTYTAFNEPKKLIAKIASTSMGISVPEPVQVKSIGSGIIQEAFIPVTPSVQLGERLGLPTEGYYYHFYQNRLVQEYKLLGDGKWQFYATRSRHDRLNQAEGFNRYQSAILVYWKIGGKEVEDQHLVYLKAPLTRDLLDNLDDEWLEENGIKLSINELLAAPKQAVVKRGDSPTDKGADNTDNSGLPLTHTVKLDPATRQRESWPAIAEQYGLSAKQLLSLNPKYNSNPMLLKAGEELIVQEGSAPQQQEHIYGWPSVDTKKYNNLSNVIYDYSVSNLNGSSIKSVNAKSVAQDELPIVNVREIEIPVEFHLGFSIVEETRSFHDFWKEELRGSPSRIQNLIKEHNQHLNDPVVPGEIVIFLTTEPYLNEQDLKLNTLKENATLASAQLGTLTPEQAEIHHTYFEVIENKLIEYWGSGKPSDTFSALGGAIGTIAPAMQENMKNVSSSLKKIDNLYLDLLSKKIARKVFIQKRQELQTLLNKQLDKLTQKTLRIPIDRGLKNSLGIDSTKSILHHADEILSKGSVSALGERIANTAKWIKYTEDAGRVAIGLSVASGAYNVTQNCDDLESCARGTLVEAGGVVGGWAGGTAGAYIGGAIVALIGAASAPVVMAVVGAATLGFGIIGAGVGKDAVKRSYKLIKLDEILEEIETNIENGIPSSVEEYINKERFNDFSVGSIF